MLVDDYPFLKVTEFSRACAAIANDLAKCNHENGIAVSLSCENVGGGHIIG